MKRMKAKHYLVITVIIFIILFIFTVKGIEQASLVGLIITILFNASTIISSNNIQKDQFLHDMVKEEISNWKYIHEERKNGNITKPVRNIILNYYEYLAFLIVNYSALKCQAS